MEEGTAGEGGGGVSAEAVAFDAQGLVPCVVQDARSGEVLTLAYMNAEALRRTRETGEVHFFSRSRGELWRKGETSGNVLGVEELRYDCDADAVLALVEELWLRAEELTAADDDNTVLATMLELSRRARRIDPREAAYWRTSAAATLVSGLHGNRQQT